MADQANAIFSLLGDDFAQMTAVPKTVDEEAAMGWYCKTKDGTNKPNQTSPGDLENLCFFTLDRDNAGADVTSTSLKGSLTAVNYWYDSANKKLYRTFINATSSPTVWSKIGTADSATPSDTSYFAANPSTDDEKEDALVADNITSFVVQANQPGGNATLPSFIKVSVTLAVPPELQNGAKGGASSGASNYTDRTFTRMFFIDQQ
jgi:hypothetical protein